MRARMVRHRVFARKATSPRLGLDEMPDPTTETREGILSLRLPARVQAHDKAPSPPIP